MEKIKVKVVMLGKQGVGKTTLCLRYTVGRFHVEKESTIGIAFFLKTVTVDGKNYSLNIWDTAGSERYNTFTKTYLRGAHFIPVCFDEPDIQDITKYIDLVKLQNNKGEIILVATKCEPKDSTPVDTFFLDTLSPYGEIESFAKEHGYKLFYTSSSNGNGVEELFDYIALQCSKLSTGTTPVPTTIKIDTTPSDQTSKCCFYG